MIDDEKLAERALSRGDGIRGSDEQWFNERVGDFMKTDDLGGASADVDTDDDLFLHGESFHSVEILTVLYHRIRGNATVE